MRKYLEIGERFKNQVKNNSRQLLKGLVGAALVISLTGCESPQKGYESGSTKIEIEGNQAEIEALIKVYNSYFDTYEKYQETLISLETSGDVKGYQNTLAKATDLKETILKTEKEIDNKGNKVFKLTKKYNKGKVKSAGAEVKNAGSSKNPVKLTRRTFKEYLHSYDLD